MNIKKSLNQFKERCLKQNLFLSKFYSEYLSTHKKVIYNVNEFLSEEFGSQIFFTFTTSSDEISCFGFPVELDNKNNLELPLKIRIIEKFLKQNKTFSKNYIFSINLKEDEIDKNIFQKLNPKLVSEQQIINLEKSEDEILKKFKSNLRYEINKTSKNKDVQVIIIDKDNYTKNFILDMMQTHISVSGRQTRSKDTWLINEKMILQNQGFLSVVYYKSKAVSYSFFFHNNYSIYYFSSVTLREYFKISGISHLSLWKAICYAKKIKIKEFNLGLTDYLYIRDGIDISPKEKNIAFFKSRYCGEKKYKIIIDQESNLYTNKF